MSSHPVAATLRAFVPLEALPQSTPGSASQMRDWASSISRNTGLRTLAHIARILDFSASGNRERDQVLVAHALFSEAERASIQSFITSVENSHFMPIVFRGQLLEAANWIATFGSCEDHGPSYLATPESAPRSSFGRCLLYSSELWSTAVFNGRIQDEDDETEFRESALARIRASLQATASPAGLRVLIARAWSIFVDHLPQIWPEFSCIFRQSTGLSIENYLAIHASLVSSLLAPRADSRKGDAAAARVT